MDSQPQATPKGDAIDEFIALPQEQQLSTLQTLAPDKQDALLAKVKARKGAATPSLPDSHPVGFLKSIQNSFDANTTTSPQEPLLQTGLKRIVKGLGSLPIHPLDTLGAMANMIPSNPDQVTPTNQPDNPIVQRGQEAVSDYQQGGLPYAATKLGADAGAAYLGGKIGEAGVGAAANVPRIVRGAANLIGDTGPKTTANLVTDTAAKNAKAQTTADTINAKAQASADTATQKAQAKTDAANAAAQAKVDAANTAAQAKVDASNAAQVTKRATDLQKHFERTQAVKEANDAAAAQLSRKAALQRGVETLDPIHKTDLTNLEATVRAEANRRYNELNANLNDEPAPPDLLTDIVSDASEAMKGSNTETPIMKDMERRIKTQDGLTYRDLQGYRSEIGRELQKGTLPGDVFHAYKGMQAAITDAMGDIANSRGLGDEFDGARDYYRRMSDTFDDPQSPIRKALNSTEAGGVVKAFKGKDKSGIEALAQYDPDLAQRINTTRGYHAEAQAIRPSAAPPKPLPTLDAKPQPIPAPTPQPPPTPQPAPPPVVPKAVAPDITKVGPAEIQAAKGEALAARSDKIRTTGHSLANTIAVLDTVRNLVHGNLAGIGTDIAARSGLSVAQHGLAAALEHPLVVNWLTKPTAADLAELERLPPAQRTAAAQNLKPLIDAATAKGLKVAPAISALTAAGTTLPTNHPLAATAPIQ